MKIHGLIRGVLCATVAVVISPQLRAQRVCLSPTWQAAVNIMVFLQTRETKPWRDSLGITERYVERLPPLTDADSTLCRRMDSTIVDKPVYYYRAGSYILASNYPDSSGRKLQSEYDVTWFVFDSRGHPVPRPSKDWLIAPYDLDVTVAAPGQVTLSWVNRSNGVSAYQLQRASPGAGYVAIGPPLSGTATTTTDSSAVAGNTYHYRLAAISAPDTAYSNTVTVTVVQPPVVPSVPPGQETLPVSGLRQAGTKGRRTTARKAPSASEPQRRRTSVSSRIGAYSEY